MPNVIAVVGWHNAGKTQFIEGLVRELKGLGLRVATLKHARGHFEIDHEGSDTWRLAQAGSDVVVIAGGHRLALVERVAEEPGLAELLTRLPAGIDLVIAEGFKREPVLKFEVLRRATGIERIAPQGELLALVTDEPELAGDAAPCLATDDYAGAVALLRARGMIDT